MALRSIYRRESVLGLVTLYPFENNRQSFSARGYLLIPGRSLPYHAERRIGQPFGALIGKTVQIRRGPAAVTGDESRSKVTAQKHAQD